MAVAFFAVIADAVLAGADVAVLAKAARGAVLIINTGVIPGIGFGNTCVGDDNPRVIFGFGVILVRTAAGKSRDSQCEKWKGT